MKRRKSPYEHPVRAHQRQGRPVTNYRRGKGDKPPHNPRRRRVVGGLNPSEFNISIFYVGEPRETFSVDAKNYSRALSAGIESREKPLPPKIIRIRREK